MVFDKYTFTKTFDGSIVFDAELKAEQLGVKPGDCFEVAIRDNKIVLEKKKYNE